jgi:hypothetical protein
MKYVYFWLILTIASLVWYSTVTVYVAIRGAQDIKEMLSRLGKQPGDSDSEENS